jgi:tRNA threonylcarbamoyladenosine biosynthesis protein TsaB
MEYYKKGIIESADEHEPDYLKKSQAEREREEKHGN